MGTAKDPPVGSVLKKEFRLDRRIKNRMNMSSKLYFWFATHEIMKRVTSSISLSFHLTNMTQKKTSSMLKWTSSFGSMTGKIIIIISTKKTRLKAKENPNMNWRIGKRNYYWKKTRQLRRTPAKYPWLPGSKLQKREKKYLRNFLQNLKIRYYSLKSMWYNPCQVKN